MSFFKIFFLTLIITLTVCIALIGCGAYVLENFDLTSKSGTVEEYSISPEDFQVKVNGEIATINNGELSTPSRNFIMTLEKEIMTYEGEVKLNVKTNDMIGLIEYNIALATGDYAKDDNTWEYDKKKGEFSVTGNRQITGNMFGLHIISGNASIEKLLKSIKIDDTVEATGYISTGAFEMILPNGEHFIRTTGGCINLMVTEIKIYR